METALENNPALWSLFEAVTRLRDPRECAHFFRDLCTISELSAMAERWHVVTLLDDGLPYRRIHELTGASTATITRIAHWYQYGEGGYRTAIRRLSRDSKLPASDTLLTRQEDSHED